MDGISVDFKRLERLYTLDGTSAPGPVRRGNPNRAKRKKARGMTRPKGTLMALILGGTLIGNAPPLVTTR